MYVRKDVIAKLCEVGCTIPDLLVLWKWEGVEGLILIKRGIPP